MTAAILKARLWLLLLILGAPLLGFVVSTVSRSHLTTTLHEEWATDPALRNRILPTVAALCRSTTDTLPICASDALLAVLGAVSIAAGSAGLVLLGAITIVGYRARSNRETLLALFRPGLYVIAMFVTALIVVHAGILLGTIFLSVDHAPAGIVLTIIMGAAGGVVAISSSAFRVVHRAETGAFGRALTIEQAGALGTQTRDIADRLGALQPDQIVVGLDPTFFVTEATVNTPDGSLSGRTLFCSLPLARILTVDEFSAIIGHELGHFRGEDTQWSEKFYPIYRGSIDAIASLHAAAGRRGWGGIVILPAIALFNFFLERFAVAERLHSRSRELLADQAGAEAASARVMATALVKVHAFTESWGTTLGDTIGGLQERQLRQNLSTSFADAVATSATPQVLKGIAETSTSHPTDTHPPLAVRLASLEVELDSVAADALSVRPGTSASSLIPQADSYEEALSETYQRMIAQRLGINIGR